MKEEVDLSIVVATYNHEKYIEKALYSILNQKTSYKYEVWIGDDGSTDNTPNILRKLQTYFPSNFHFIIRDKNIGVDANFNDLYSKTNGKYLAVLEGDDYWINLHKIQRQIEFLEKNSEYFATAHNVVVVDKNDKERNDYKYPECKNIEYTLSDFKYGILCGQTASIISKNYFKLNDINWFTPSVSWAGDRTRNFMFASYGKVYCFQEVWSAYRYVTESGSSYSANFKMNETEEKNYLIYHRELYEFCLREVRNDNSIIVAEQMYFQIYLAAVLHKKVYGLSLNQFIKDFIHAKHKMKCLVFIFKKRRKNGR